MGQQSFNCTNRSKNTVLGTHIKKADHYFARLVGLLPKSSLPDGEGLWIIPCAEIHSIGMRFLFDAAFLNADNTVVHVVESMKPLRITPMIKGAKTVLEIPAGKLALTQTVIGDTLVFEPQS